MGPLPGPRQRHRLASASQRAETSAAGVARMGSEVSGLARNHGNRKGQTGMRRRQIPEVSLTGVAFRGGQRWSGA